MAQVRPLENARHTIILLNDCAPFVSETREGEAPRVHKVSMSFEFDSVTAEYMLPDDRTDLLRESNQQRLLLSIHGQVLLVKLFR